MDAFKVDIKAVEQDIVNCNNINQLEQSALYPIHEVKHLYEIKIQYLQLLQEFQVLQQENHILKNTISTLDTSHYSDGLKSYL